MAAKGTIGGKIVLEGEKAYREALKGIKSEQAGLRSEMKLCQSEFKNSQNSLEALTKKHEILTKQVETQSKKIEVYQKAMETSAQKQEKAADKVADLQTALDKAEKEMEEMKSSSEENSGAMEEQAKVIEDLKNKLSLAEESYNKAEQKTKDYQTSINYATAELNSMQGELDQTSRHLAEAENSTDKCAKSIDEYGKETEEAAGKTNVFGDVLKANLASEAIIAGVKKLTEGIKQVADASIEVGSEFEASMSQVAATMGITSEEINAGSEDYEKLSAAAKKCGQTTKYSASESAEALNYLALAGYNVDKSVETLPKVLNLAAAGGLDLAYASDLVTDSMAALGLEAKDLDTYIDEMARTSQKSNTSVAQLGEATLVCAGTVSLAGQSLETMNAELGVLANNGIKGAEGGTHLRNVILSLSAPTDTAAVAIKELGIQINDSKGNMRDLNDILTDMDAAMEGMSSAEKTQMINRIFNKTDIAAVNALLKGTGEEFDSLTEELKSCSGAAEDMASTMNNNLKGKVTILKSSLEALGISAYEIFDDDMKKAVDGATDAVGRLQKSIDKGELGVSLNKMSKSLGEFCENAIDVGEDALPVVIDGFTWILDHADLIIAGTTGIVAANLEMKVVGPAIEAAGAAWKAYQTANEGATVSQWLLNTAMEANPAGILVTAIVGLTAAVAAYILINKDNLSVMDETTQKTKELVEETKTLNEEYANSTAGRKTAKEEMLGEATVAKNLAAELKELENKTSRTTAEQARMKLIVEELNQLVPELNLVIDEQTGNLNMSTDAIEQNIEALTAMARAEAAREDLAEIAREQYEAERNLIDLEAQLDDQLNATAEAYERMNEVSEEYVGSEVGRATALHNATVEYQNAVIAQEELEEQIKATKETIDGFTAEYAETLEYISDTESYAEASAAVDSLGDAAVGTAEDFVTMSSGVSEAFTAMYDSVSESVQSQMELFSQFKGEAELTTQELLDNMQSQVDGITQWADNLETLAERGINQGLLQHLADLGPEGAGYVATFVDMTDEELQKASELYEQSLTLSDDTASKVAEAYENAGKNAAEGFKLGISDTAEDVQGAAEEMAQGTLDTAKDVLDINSPSKEFEQIGEYVDQGLVGGIKDNQKNVLDIIESLCSSMLQTGRNGITTTDWQTIGKRIPDGLATGIRAGQSSVVSAIVDMCTKAVEAAKQNLDIHSPSRQFAYLGEMSGEGYITGWKQSMANIESVISNSLPDASMLTEKQAAANEKVAAGRQYNINQEINIYALENDPVDAAKKFKDSQREAAEAW